MLWIVSYSYYPVRDLHAKQSQNISLYIAYK